MSELLSSIHSIEELLERIPDAEERLAEFYDFLKNSEQQLLAVIADVRAGNEPAPISHDAEGDLEFGLFLYWLNNPVEELERAMSENTAHLMAYNVLRHFASASLLSSDDFNFLSGYKYGIVGADGTLWMLGKYAQLDPGWLTVGVNYAINLLDPKSIYHPYPAASQGFNESIGCGKESVSSVTNA